MTISCQLSIITLLITSNIINHQLGPTNHSRLCLLFVPVVATQQRWEWWRCSILVEIKTSRCRSRLPILICCWDAGRVVRVRLRVSESELPFFTSLIAGAAAGLCFGGALVRGFLVIALLLGATATFIDFINGFALAFTFTDFIAFFAFAPRLLELAPAAAAVAIALVRAITNVGSESVHEQVWYKHILPWLRDHCTLTMTCTIRSDLLTLRMKRRGPSIKSSPWFWNVFQSLQQKKVWTVRNSQAKNSGFQMKECRTTNQPLI